MARNYLWKALAAAGRAAERRRRARLTRHVVRSQYMAGPAMPEEPNPQAVEEMVSAMKEAGRNYYDGRDDE